MERLKYRKGHNVLWNPNRHQGFQKGHNLSGYTTWVKRAQVDYPEKGPWQRQTQEEMKDSYLVFSYIRGTCVKAMGERQRKLKIPNKQSKLDYQTEDYEPTLKTPVRYVGCIGSILSYILSKVNIQRTTVSNKACSSFLFCPEERSKHLLNPSTLLHLYYHCLSGAIHHSQSPATGPKPSYWFPH